MRKFLWVFICFFLCGVSYAESNFSYYGYLKNETSLRLNNFNSDLTKEKEIMMLAGQYTFNPDLVLFSKVKYFYDFAYSHRSQMDPAGHYMEHVQRTEWLRDAYLDYTNGSWFLRLGKQQVAWGQSDGIAVLDKVDPVDLREYWLPDMEDIRIPVWTINVNYSPKINSNLQLLCIPDFEESQVAPPGSPFTIRAYKIFDSFRRTVAGIPGGRLNVNMHPPGDRLNMATWGLQWSDRLGDLDYTLNFLYGPYTTARNTTTGTFPVLTVSRDYKLWRVYGASFNKTFTNPGPMQGITIKGDFAWYNDEPTYFGNPEAATPSTSGVVRWDNKFWILGIDKYFLTKWLVGFQFGQYIMEHGKNKDSAFAAQNQYPMNAFTNGRQDPVENIFSLKIATGSGFMNDRLKPEILWSLTDDNQGRLSPKVSYEIVDNLVGTLGIHYFYGDPRDSNGQFRDESQYYCQMKYSF